MAAIEGSGGEGGVVLPLTMSGDGYEEAIYSLSVTVSSGATFEMQIDCGSSDAWLAASSCRSAACQRAGTSLYGWSGTTVDSGVLSEFNYLVGRVQGNIVWDTLQLGNYTFANQVLLSASQVDNERLTSHFVGLIGLAQEDNSILVSQFADSLQFPVSTFSTKLFSLPTPPASRTIGISLERPGQPKSGTPSLLSIGRHPSSVVSDPSKIVYTPITDNGHWRLPVTEIAAWSVGSYDSTAGTYGPGQRTELTLGSTAASGVYSIWPLAIVDTGGAHIISTRSLANMFWGAYGIGPASDGMYYVPCKTPINVTLELGGVHYAIHPLDMSYISSSDPYSGMCVGAWQASDTLYAADLVLGSTFLRNVYTVLQYDNPRTGSAQYDPSTARPQLGLMSLTSWEQGLKDFYRVRVLNEPLESSSSGSGSGSSGGSSSSGSSGTFGTTEKSRKLSVGIIALIGVMAFFGIAASLFGARWWVMQRRWKRLRAAAQAQEAAGEKDDTSDGGLAMPRPSRLDKDEEYERAHSAVYNRDSVVWDAETATVIGARPGQNTRAKNRKNNKTHSYVGSRVGLMGEWVEPDSDEEDGPGVRASAGLGSSAASTSGGLNVRESWATVKPRETSELDLLERAARTMSLAGVGAGSGTVQFIGGSIDWGRPASMPADIAQAAESPGGIRGVAGPQALSGGLHHRPTYSRDDSTDGGIGSPLLRGGSRSPLGQATFAPEDLVIPSNLHADSGPGIDQLAQGLKSDELDRARPSVDVGLGAETDGPTPRPTVDIPRFGGNATPVNRGSMDIASPSSHWGPRPR